MPKVLRLWGGEASTHLMQLVHELDLYQEQQQLTLAQLRVLAPL
jgi:hypothetical protein